MSGGGVLRSGDKARLKSGELGLFTLTLLDFDVLLFVFVGDMTVPPDLVVRGDGLRAEAFSTDGVRASGDTGIHEMERRRGEWTTERASFGNTPCRNAEK